MKKNRLILPTLILALAASIGAHAQRFTTIRNGLQWTDTRGEMVQAHGGNFLQVGKKWYLIGEDRSRSWNPDVNLYSTTDFQTWTFEAKIIENGVTHPELGRSRMIERPKLMYNAQTGKYVVWCHWEARNYGASEAGVFEADSITGPYRTVWTGRPIDTKSRDCNIFVDHDGTAYFISTTDENTNLGLFTLSSDYHSATAKTVLCEGMRREAPAIVNIHGTYHMISSACTGWDPNQALITTSRNLHEGWSTPRRIGDRITYDTQASSILTIAGTKDTTYIYVGDRWMDPDLPHSKIIMLPIEFDKDGNMQLNWREEWQIDLKRGTWRDVKKKKK
jgi:hypothetical protein